MIRSPRFVSTLALSLVFAIAAAAFVPSTAMAKPPSKPFPSKPFPKPLPVIYPIHHDHHYYHGGFGVYAGGGPYVVAEPYVVTEPVANQAVYTLYFKDKLGQTKVYAQYTATVYDNGVTNWDGLIEARDSLRAAGVECWISAGQWVGITGG
jgi:hypothetical protein